MDIGDFMVAARAAAQQRYNASASTRGGKGRESGNYLPDQTRDAMLKEMAGQQGGTLATIGRVLDTPNAIFRGALAGDPASGFSWSDDRRTSGEELLRQYGLLSPNAHKGLATAAGLLTEVALDPFAIAKFPLQALNISGKAAKAAGIIDKASDAAVAKIGFDEAVKQARNSRTGRASLQFLESLLPFGKGVTPENVKYRPLIGPRVARTMVNLEETIKASDDPAKAMQDVLNYLKGRGIDYDAIKGQPLGGAFGLGYFNAVDPIVFNPAGARPYLDALDALGQGARWSAPVRAAARFVDQRVDGTFTPYEQISSMQKFDTAAREVAQEQERAAQYLDYARSIKLPDAAKKILGAESLLDPNARKFLRRFAENVHTQSDMRLRSIIGPRDVDTLVGYWKYIRDDIANQAKSLGMKNFKTRDIYGAEWSPRKAFELVFGEYGSGAGRSAYNTQTLENILRNPKLRTPGATVDLEEISQLPLVQRFVREGMNSKLSIEDVGTEIKRFIDEKHGPRAADPRVVPFKTFVPKLGPDGKPLLEPALDAAGQPKMVRQRTTSGKLVVDPATNQPKMVPVMKKVFDPDQVISQSQANEIARSVMRRDTSVPEEFGLFSEHPIKAQVRTMINQAQARGNAKHIQESIVNAAIRAPAGRTGNAVPGTRLKPLDRALDEIAAKTGMATTSGDKASKVLRDSIKASLARMNGIAPDAVDLSRFALPEDVLNRLTRTVDFVSNPRAQEDVVSLFNQYTTLFKGFALGFPATKVRDMYSNVFLVWTQAGNAGDVYRGYVDAARVMAGKIDEAVESLKEIPAYNQPGVTPNYIRQMVQRDVARTGILRTLSSSDLLTSDRSAMLNQLLPGSSPMTLGGSIKEMIPDGSRNPVQMAQDFFTFRGVRLPGQAAPGFETKNAIFNSSQKASDWIDSVSRLGGMFALMRQGVSADEAARRISSALVDYGSLTQWERNYARSVFVWWAYQSRIGKYVVEQLLQNPGGGYAQTLRGFNVLQRSDEDTYIPEALRQQFAFRVPDAMKPYLGIDPNSRATTFLKDIDIPGFDVLSLLDSGNPTSYGKFQGTLFNVAQQIHPLYRSGLELTTGMDTFSRRPLQQAVTPLDRLYMRAFDSKTSLNPLVRQAINLTPGPQQRLISVFGGLADSERIPSLRQRVAKQAFNALTGMKLQDVDPEWQLQDARRLLAQQLGGFMQDYTESYIPDEVLPQLPMELVPQYQLFRTLGRDLRRSRQSK